ncbi:TPR repeat region-containing protein [Streptomyces millisiae]|uniref:TPR repeat domain-containing protein n=1 Tax=Streptomyces millisiae TaxID=3075542 RepID=A0ABU2LX12_9ACTN|nr:hypothetical protein [Streptomyces sp. DSM 44918]MDT0322070.1 hypothetical protein [Streptomyces sp. DSM 44918]
MADLTFTRADVEAEAKKQPWQRCERFSTEIDPDDMADTAASYARAADEAHGAGELAARATRVAAESGGLDGDHLVDAEGRIVETAEGLQGNGEDLDQVLNHLVRAMNQAIDTRDEVRGLVFEPGGLEEKYQRHVQAAVDEWNAWQGALTDRVAQANRDGTTRTALGTPVALWVTHGGKGVLARPTFQGGDLVYHLPDDLPGEVRAKHLRAAADDAGAAYDDITEAIDQYTRKLAEWGQLLEGLGLDTTGGPLDLWTSPTVAEVAAESLAELLRQPRPDPELLALYTEGLTQILEGAPRGLTEAERDYLTTFYGRLDVQALSALGQLNSDLDDLADGPGRDAAAERMRAVGRAQEAVANGINVLTDPERGGLDVATEAGRAAVPASIRAFVYDYEGGGMFRTDYPGPTFSPAELRLFNGFGELMSHATTAPGDTFARDLATAAVDIQTATSTQYHPMSVEVVSNTGSSGLLEAVSLNTEASAGLLNDGDFRDLLLRQEWEDSTGVGELIRSGTTIPEGVDHNDAAAKPYVQAAFNLLSDVDDHDYWILVPEHSPQEELGRSDHSGLQRAIGDTALRYMNMISQFPGDAGSQFLEPSNPDDPNARRFTNLFGQDHRYGFQLSREDRQGLFELMNGTMDTVRSDFRSGVGEWQALTAYQAFSSGTGEAAALEAVGRVAGFVEHADIRAIDNGIEPARLETNVLNGLTSGAGAVATLAGASNPVSAGVALGAYGLTAAVRGALGPVELTPQQLAEIDAIESGDWDVRALVAHAALAADYGNAQENLDRYYGRDNSALPRAGSPDTVYSDLMNAVSEIETKSYPGAEERISRGYEDALGK